MDSSFFFLYDFRMFLLIRFNEVKIFFTNLFQSDPFFWFIHFLFFIFFWLFIASEYFFIRKVKFFKMKEIFLQLLQLPQLLSVSLGRGGMYLKWGTHRLIIAASGGAHVSNNTDRSFFSPIPSNYIDLRLFCWQSWQSWQTWRTWHETRLVSFFLGAVGRPKHTKNTKHTKRRLKRTNIEQNEQGLATSDE